MMNLDNGIVYWNNSPNSFQDIQLAYNSKIFQDWKNRITKDFEVEKIIIHKVFMFGNRVGFIIVETKAKYNNKPVPGIVFLRGDSVSIMPILKCNGKEYTTIVTEPRIPVGNNSQKALPAGMVDNDTVICAALKELSEEIGNDFNITENDLINLGKFPLSAGGSDENIFLYAFEMEITEENLNKINNRQNGVETEHEQILVNVIKLEDIKNIEGIDARSLLSYFLWKNRNV